MAARLVTPYTALEPFESNGKIPVYSRDFNALVNALGIAGAKVYEILISQSGTDAPQIVSLDVDGTPNPFVNTLGGTPVLSRDAEGYYLITLTGAFPQGKTICEIQKQGLLATNVLSKSEEAIRWSDINSISILTTDGTGGALSGGTDGILNYHYVRIIVKP